MENSEKWIDAIMWSFHKNGTSGLCNSLFIYKGPVFVAGNQNFVLNSRGVHPIQQTIPIVIDELCPPLNSERESLKFIQ